VSPLPSSRTIIHVGIDQSSLREGRETPPSHGSFTPQRVTQRQRRLDGVDDPVLRWYARGLSTREMQAHLEALEGTEVSPTLIATITDAVLDAGRPWQSRPLASVYPLLYCDA